MRAFFAFIVVAAILAGSGYYAWQHHQQKKLPLEPKLLGKLEIRERILEKVSAVGRLAPKNRAIVTVDVPIGRIVQIHPGAEVGKMVTRGQPLLQLDDDTVRAKVAEARAAVTAAEATAKQAEAARQKALAGVAKAEFDRQLAWEEGERRLKIAGDNATKSDRDAVAQARAAADAGLALAQSLVTEAEAAVKAAEANIQKAQEGLRAANRFLEQLTIRAPVDGLILDRHSAVLLGATISPQVTPLFVIMPDPNAWEVQAQVGEGDIAQVKVGQTARFTLEAYSGEGITFTGKVTRIADVPTNNTVRTPTGLEVPATLFGPATYTVTIDVDYDSETVGKHPLKAGLTANVDITTRGVENQLAVPAAALQFRPDPMPLSDQAQLESSNSDGLAPLWLWEQGQMRLVFVRRGATDGQWVQILNKDADWAKPGTLVVIEGPPAPEPVTFFGAKSFTLR